MSKELVCTVPCCGATLRNGESCEHYRVNIDGQRVILTDLTSLKATVDAARVEIHGTIPTTAEIESVLLASLTASRERNLDLADKEPWLFGEGDPPWIKRWFFPPARER